MGEREALTESVREKERERGPTCKVSVDIRKRKILEISQRDLSQREISGF